MRFKKMFLTIMVIALTFTMLFSCKNVKDDNKNDLYIITNPHTFSSKIFKKDGDVILSTFKPKDEYISIINDEKTGKPMCLQKTFIGEKKLEDYYEADGEQYSYNYPSQRLVLYDVDGNEIGFDMEINGGIAFGFNNMVFYFKGEDRFLYNIVTGEEKSIPQKLVNHFKNYIILSDYLWGNATPSDTVAVGINDENLNLIKTIPGYSYDYVANIGGKEYIRISCIKDKEKGNVSYNFLDDDLNLIFDKPIDNNVYNEDTSQVECKRDGKKFVFDFETFKMIGDEVVDDTVEEPYDPDKYDREAKELDEKFSDIDSNAIWYSIEKDGVKYYYNSFDKEYNQKESYLLCDENKNIILKDIVKINFYASDEYILCEHTFGSKLYDCDFNVVKDFGGIHIDPWSWITHKTKKGNAFYSYNNYEKTSAFILDESFNQIIGDLKYVGMMEDDYFTYMQGFEYGFMDYKGNVLYKFSIFDDASDEDNTPVGEVYYEEERPKNVINTYPRVDGSTANMPMMAQIRSSYLGEDLEISKNNVEVTTTDYAWRNLIEGKNDLLLVYEPSAETKKIIEESNVKLKVTPIGVDALVFITNEDNPVTNLSTQDLIDIYIGKKTNWIAFNGENKAIEAFQRPLNSGSQTLFLNLLMKDNVPMDAPKSYRPQGMGDLIEVLASYNNKANAIGYSVFYYAKKMYEVPGLHMISVDGVEPTDTTISDGSYPFLNEYYLVIREDTPSDSETMKLYNYILSDKGKEDIKNAGYIPK